MKESTIITGWIEEGKARGQVETKRADVLTALQTRLPGPAPEPVRLALEGTNDLATLERWFRAALTADSWDTFQAAMKAT